MGGLKESGLQETDMYRRQALPGGFTMHPMAVAAMLLL